MAAHSETLTKSSIINLAVNSATHLGIRVEDLRCHVDLKTLALYTSTQPVPIDPATPTE